MYVETQECVCVKVVVCVQFQVCVYRFKCVCVCVPQVQLSPLRPGSQRQQEEHSLAAERRRMRRVHDDIIKDLLSDRTFQQGA